MSSVLALLRIGKTEAPAQTSCQEYVKVWMRVQDGEDDLRVLYSTFHAYIVTILRNHCRAWRTLGDPQVDSNGLKVEFGKVLDTHDCGSKGDEGRPGLAALWSLLPFGQRNADKDFPIRVRLPIICSTLSTLILSTWDKAIATTAPVSRTPIYMMNLEPSCQREQDVDLVIGNFATRIP